MWWRGVIVIGILVIASVNCTELVNDDTESVIVEAAAAAAAAAPIDDENLSSPTAAVPGVNDPQEHSISGNGEASVNSWAAAPNAAADSSVAQLEPDRDSFLDWISAFLKPNQPSSPVLPIGDPPEDCPPCECGIPNKKKRIVGGVEAEVLYYPWMAVMMYGGRFYCGGALITDRYVLTAAHCLKGFNYKQISVKFLEHDMKDTTESTTITRNILGYKIHKLYSTSNYNCDIGLVKLSDPVDIMKANPICLAEKHKAFINENSVVAGWGATSEGGSLSNKLLQVEVPVWSNAECKMSGYGKNRITDNMLCAGFKEGGKDACQGDSGGPLMLNYRDNRYSVIGVVSWGQGCAKKNYPGVYSRVNRFHTWIMNNTIDSCHCSPPA